MSSEEVEGDDMVVLYFEEEEDSNDGQDAKIPYPITIKVEPFDESSEKSISEVTEVFDTSQGKVKEKTDHQKVDTNEENDLERNDDQGKEVNQELDLEKKLANILNEEPDYTLENKLSENVLTEDSQHNELEAEAEVEYHAEYLDEVAIKQELLNLPEEYEVEFLEDEELLNDTFNEPDDEEYTLPDHKHKPRKSKSDEKYVSVAEQLRELYPELKNNTEKLVEELAEMMRQAKPPPPPPNYYKIVVESATNYQYECSFCGRKQPTLPLAARHYQFSHGDDYLTCLACGVTHRNTTNLYKHEKRCPAPDAKLVLRARGHYLGRKGRGRPYTTDNKFITSNTRALMHKYEKGRRLFCSKCPASFAHRENLEAHEYSHDGVRPFCCGRCPARYTSAPALRRHYQAMHGDQQFICDHCGASFKLKPLLVSHMNSHRALRKYPCEYCDRRFSQKNALRHHTNKVHLNLPAAHGCPLCPKRYPRMTQVKNHVSDTHGLTMITRRMYYQSLPNLPQEALQVTLQPSIVNHKLDSDNNKAEKTKHYIKPLQQHVKNKPNKAMPVKQEIEHMLPDWPLQEYVELDLRDTNDDTFISYVVVKDGVTKRITTDIREQELLTNLLDSDENSQENNCDKEIEAVESKPTISEIPEVPEVPQKPKRSHKRKRRPTPPPIDDSHVVYDSTIEFQSKRERKEKRQTPSTSETPPVDENVNKVVREIKSTLKMPKMKYEFPKLGRNPVNIELKPVIKPTVEDEKDWKDFKKLSSKDQVVAEFLEYMRSKKVPPKLYPIQVPILRKMIGPQADPGGPSQWLERTREEIVIKPDPDEEEPASVEIPELIIEEQ